MDPSIKPISAAPRGLTPFRDRVTEGLRTAVFRVQKIAGILADPRTFLRVSVTLMLSGMRRIFHAEPRLIFKYLGPYIAAHLSRRERATILIDHYSFLDGVAGQQFARTIVNSRLELWRHDAGQNDYRIVLTFPRETHDEGDLALIFEADGIDIYTLSFAIGRASLSGAFDGHALYIARVQGKAKGLPVIRRATKECGDISPAWLLLAAAEGIAGALNIRHMLGVVADNQVSADKAQEPDQLIRAYDEFWISAGGIKLDREIYHLPVPAELKPLQAIRRDHRRRALRKREFRRGVTVGVCTSFTELALRA